MNSPGLDGKLAKFLDRAGVGAGVDFETRRIGTDDEMVRLIIERIVIGEKTMTYSLPWLARVSGRTPPVPGRHLVVQDARENPVLLLKLEEVRELVFGEVGVDDIQREGLPMRDLDAWRPLHIQVWNEKLAPLGRKVTDSMPVWAEYFELLFDGS